MNRDRALELFPIFEAYANGEEIQWWCADSREWLPEDDFGDNDVDDFKYRIKSKPREFWVCWDGDDWGEDDRGIETFIVGNCTEWCVDHYENHIKVR